MEISRTVGIAHTSVKKNLTALVKLGFITEMLEKKRKKEISSIYSKERK
jgi:predicted transcriptional regulator